jgi:uncharacterized RDD family membrane protein YckC
MTTEGGPEDPFAKPPPSSPSEPPPYPSTPPDSPAGESDGGAPDDAEPDPLAGMPPLANRGRRLLARIADALIIGIPVYGITGAIWGNFDYEDAAASFAQSVIYAVVYLVYQVLMLTRYGQSLGKMLMKVRVAMLADGSKPTSQPALGREATYALVPVVPCCGSIFWLINVLWCTWDKPYRQCLHDKVGNTVVVSAEQRPPWGNEEATA